MTIMTPSGMYVGIDVSKERLDIAVLDAALALRERFAVANDDAGFAELIARLAGRHVAAIGLEPTGGYDRRALRALREAGLTVRRTDSWRLRQFAKALGQRAKTDPIDAAMIARFLAATPPGALEPDRDPAREKLQDLAAFRRRLVDDRVALDNRLQQLDDAELRDLCREQRDLVRRAIRTVEQRSRSLIAGHPELRRKAAILQTAPGIGFVAALTLLAELPELGSLGPKQIASLLGLAPYARQSGKADRKGRCQGGRVAPRNALFIAILSQLRRHAWAQQALQSLHARGKPKMVGIVALMRKLLLALNAMLKQNRTWRDTPLAP
jgi:transposase